MNVKENPMPVDTREKEFELTKVGGQSTEATPEAEDPTGALRGPGPRKTKNLKGLDILSGGQINAVIVWRNDGEVDVYLPDGKILNPQGGASDETPPKRSMRDHELPAADIILINGYPKLASVNGTVYEIKDDPSFSKIGSTPQN